MFISIDYECMYSCNIFNYRERRHDEFQIYIYISNAHVAHGNAVAEYKMIFKIL